MTRSRTLLAALLAAATLASATPASAEAFTLLIYETPASYAKRDDAAAAPAYWGSYAEIGKAMADAGIMRGGSPLAPPAQGLIVGTAEADSGDALILGGWFQIEVATLDEAVAWAKRLPAASDGRIEVRAAAAAPGM